MVLVLLHFYRLFCFNAPWKLTLLLTQAILIFRFTPFGWVPKRTVPTAYETHVAEQSCEAAHTLWQCAHCWKFSVIFCGVFICLYSTVSKWVIHGNLHPFWNPNVKTAKGNQYWEEIRTLNRLTKCQHIANTCRALGWVKKRVRTVRNNVEKLQEALCHKLQLALLEFLIQRFRLRNLRKRLLSTQTEDQSQCHLISSLLL